MTKRYLGSRSDKVIGYTVCTYGMYGIRLQVTCLVHNINCQYLLLLQYDSLLCHSRPSCSPPQSDCQSCSPPHSDCHLHCHPQSQTQTTIRVRCTNITAGLLNEVTHFDNLIIELVHDLAYQALHKVAYLHNYNSPSIMCSSI